MKEHSLFAHTHTRRSHAHHAGQPHGPGAEDAGDRPAARGGSLACRGIDDAAAGTDTGENAACGFNFEERTLALHAHLPCGLRDRRWSARRACERRERGGGRESAPHSASFFPFLVSLDLALNPLSHTLSPPPPPPLPTPPGPPRHRLRARRLQPGHHHPAALPPGTAGRDLQHANSPPQHRQRGPHLPGHPGPAAQGRVAAGPQPGGRPGVHPGPAGVPQRR